MIKLLISLLTMQRQNRPTHAAVNSYIASLLPLKENDVARLYHIPKGPRYDPETAVVEQIVLSVTPTPGVYSLIGQLPEKSTDTSTRCYPPIPPRPPRPPRTICFLHRPFNLDRHSLRDDTLVLASHTSFDEVLTVGWNPVLAGRLGFEVEEASCIQGYKNDLERKLGIIGRVFVSQAQLLGQIRKEFGDTEFVLEGLSEETHVVAIMNAFSEDEVHRVLDTARDRGWISLADDGRHVLYMTGQPRIAGLEAAKTLGMAVACVGHHQAEDWGIRYIAAQLRNRYSGLRVEEVHEKDITSIQKQTGPNHIESEQ